MISVEILEESRAQHDRAVLLQAQSLTVELGGALVLRNFSLTAKSGHLLRLHGPNGCGKSTLLAVLAGYLRPSTGKVTISMADPGGRPFLMPQYPILFEDLDVIENLRLISGSKKQPCAAMTEACNPLVQALGNLDRYAGVLSTGQQRILLLLAAMQSRSQILLLDEPLAGIAASLIKPCRLLFTYAISKGRTVIISDPSA